MRRSFLLLAALAAAAALTAGFASSAGAYGGGASHDTWQIGFVLHRHNPAAALFPKPGEGPPELWGVLGWGEVDRFSAGGITGGGQGTGGGHRRGRAGAGDA